MQVSAAMSSQSTSSTAPVTSSPVEKGVAGRINYAAWDKVATDLVQQVDQEDQVEIADQKAKVCVSGVCICVCMYFCFCWCRSSVGWNRFGKQSKKGNEDDPCWNPVTHTTLLNRTTQNKTK